MIEFPLDRLLPADAAVYAALGMKAGSRASPRSAALLRRARELFQELSEPRGLSREVTVEEFAVVFHGLGRNAPGAPLERIFPRAAVLRLFAFTLGEPISVEIGRLFAGTDFALGSVLDAVASEATDKAGRLAEEWAEDQANGRHGEAKPRSFLYSPGYCGWHISAQERLFAALRPETIGLRLNDSFLMTPLKSLSGVLVTGPAAIHRADGTYPFCAQCQSPACRERETVRPA